MTSNGSIPLYEIPVASVENWADEVETILLVESWAEMEAIEQRSEEDIMIMSQYAEVASGRALLKTSEGELWGAPVTGEMLDYIVAHKGFCAVYQDWPFELPTILFNRQTLDTKHAYCCGCFKYVDLSADVRRNR